MGDKLKELWGLESPLLLFFKKLGWVFLMNILFIITSIPIVTAGASAVGMYTVFHKMIEERDFSFFGDYFRAFGRNFLKATVMWLLTLAVVLILAIDISYVFTGMTGVSGMMMRVGTILLSVAVCMIGNALFPVISAFDISLKEILPRTFQILLEHPVLALESVGFTVLVLGGSAAILYSGWFGGLFILFPMIAFGLHGFMQSYIYRQMFAEYFDEDEIDIEE
jgi:uncharacterized membrane protein YesL